MCVHDFVCMFAIENWMHERIDSVTMISAVNEAAGKV